MTWHTQATSNRAVTVQVGSGTSRHRYLRTTRLRVTLRPSFTGIGSCQDERKQRSARQPHRGSRHPVCHNGARTMIDYASVRSTASRTSAKPDLTERQNRPEIGSVLRRARMHHQLSLRDVERRIGRSNAYLSQVERGKIKQPDPIVLLDLAELYGLNFETLAIWARWVPADWTLPMPARATRPPFLSVKSWNSTPTNGPPFSATLGLYFASAGPSCIVVILSRPAFPRDP